MSSVLLKKATFDEEQTTAPSIWMNLHVNAKFRFDSQVGQSQFANDGSIDVFDRKALKKLSEFPADRWWDMCEAIGPTVYGAVAVSWCAGAEIQQVWNGWEASEFPLMPRPEFERPAQFINPALLPSTASLVDIAAASDRSNLAVCGAIAALKSPLEFDLPRETMLKAPPQVASFLLDRAQKQGFQDESLLSTWRATIEGTEYALQ